ncbi:MAG: alpha/beta fold hydrolase [Anaerolineaceae bacterium]|nr:alpha/beta fold hydrolase [Anaerolineaceae bacterium]
MSITLFLKVLILSMFLIPTSGLEIHPAIAANAADAEIPRFEESSCMFDLPAGVIEGKDIRCGYLIVPEEYKNPAGPSIRVAIAIIPTYQPNPQPDPVVMLQGGPGGSTIYTYTTQLFTPGANFKSNRDIILLEQRGTLYSQPALTCPEIIEETIRTLNQDLTPEENSQLYEQALLTCHNRLIKEGVNLSAFNSLENAADIESLRTALGYKQINLYGVSYGTLLALHTMQYHPQGIRSVILDAVVPTQINFLLESPRSQQRAFDKLFSSCASVEDCDQYYPDLEKIFQDTIKNLQDKPAEITITDFDNGNTYPAKLNGDSFRSAVFQMMYITEIIPLLPKVIYEASDGEFGFLQRILSLLTIDRTMSYGMYYSVLCAEDADFSAGDIQVGGLTPASAETEKEGILSFLRTCQQWDVALLSEANDQPVKSSIPTLILNGDFDPITPPAFGQAAAETLKNSYTIIFPTGGHGAAFTSDCANNIMQEFLEDPSKKPDTSCIAEKTSPEFMTPSNTIFLPVIGKLMNLGSKEIAAFLIFTAAALFISIAPIIWFVIWLVRKVTKKLVMPRVWFAVSLRWAVVFNAFLSVLFLGLLTFISFRLALKNELIILYGLPASNKVLFLLPWGMLILTGLMLGGTIFTWVRGYWSIWNRVYFSFVTLAACINIFILGTWGMISAIFQ